MELFRVILSLNNKSGRSNRIFLKQLMKTKHFLQVKEQCGNEFQFGNK